MEDYIWVVGSLYFDPLQMPFIIQWIEFRFSFFYVNFCDSILRAFEKTLSSPSEVGLTSDAYLGSVPKVAY